MNRIISFDYAIKAILRDKADYDIIGKLIATLLSGYCYGTHEGQKTYGCKNKQPIIIFYNKQTYNHARRTYRIRKKS